MDNIIFSSITSEYYTRRYELVSERTGGVSVTIYAECHKNTEYRIGQLYHLEILFSAGSNTRESVLRVDFGTNQMDKGHLDAEIDGWVRYLLSEDSFYQSVYQHILFEERLLYETDENVKK